MKYCLLLLTALAAMPAAADIYKCREADGSIVYQGTPCTGTELGKVQEPPPVSAEEQRQAQERLRQMQDASRQLDLLRAQERQQELEAARLRAEAERARLELERSEQYYWYPWLQRYPAYHNRRHHDRDHAGQDAVVPRKREGIHCVPAYIGDKRCR